MIWWRPTKSNTNASKPATNSLLRCSRLLVAANEVQYQCLKTRDQQPFALFKAHVDWAQRRILTKDNMSPGEATNAGNMIDELELDFDNL